MMTRKPARVILLKDARQKLNPEPAPRWRITWTDGCRLT